MMLISTVSKIKTTRQKTEANFLKKYTLLFLAAVFFFLYGMTNSQAVEVPLVNSVPKEVGLCIQVKQFKQQLPKIKTSEFVKRLSKFRVIRKWLKSRQFNDVRKVVEAVEQATGEKFEVVLNNFIGEECLFGIAPASFRKEPHRVFLTRTKNPQFLKNIIKIWNQFDNPKLIKHQYSGVEYVHRKILDDSGKTLESAYYAILGRDFILADNKFAMQQVLATRAESEQLEEKGAGQKSLAASKTFQEVQSRIGKSVPVRVYVRPSTWGSMKHLPIDEKRVFEPLLKIWDQSDAIYATLQFEKGLLLNLAAYRKNWKQKQSPEVTKLKFRNSIPANSFLSISGFGSWKRLGQWFDHIPAPNDKEANQFRRVMKGLFGGDDLFLGLFPNLGPEWAVYLQFSPEKKILPLDATAVVGLLEGTEEKEKTNLIHVIDNGLSIGVNLLSVAYNTGGDKKVAAVVQTLRNPKAISRYVKNMSDWSPGYTVQESSLLITSDFLKRGQSRTGVDPPKRLPQTAWFKKHTERFSRSSFLLWFDIKKFRSEIEINRLTIVNSIVQLKKLKPNVAEEKLSRFMEVFDLFDAAVVQLEFKTDELRLTVGALIEESSAKP